MQEEQQRARLLTRDLLHGVLDVQLRQLEENGLSDQEIYRDIHSLRQKLGDLVETEMAEATDLLVEAMHSSAEQQAQLFKNARQKVRTVVRQLSIERQMLLKRLRIVELAEQVRRLLRHQTNVQLATRDLSQAEPIQQESLTLKMIEDQRDVKELFVRLVETLDEMKTSNGVLASAAADGLRVIRLADLSNHLDQAGRFLRDAKSEAADGEQTSVVKGLKELLKIVERAQGTLGSDSQASIERIQTLIEKQKRLRDETRILPADLVPPADLVNQQAQLQNELVPLQEIGTDNPKIQVYLQQADSSAGAAAANLLENKRNQAVVEQGRVLGNLTAIESALKEQTNRQSPDKSAEQLAKVVQDLSAAKSLVDEANSQLQMAQNKLGQSTAEAVANAKSSAEHLQRPIDDIELPDFVRASLTQTAISTKAFVQSIEDPTADTNPDERRKVQESATGAMNQSLSIVAAALTDAQRQAAAIKIGELSRGVEVLERLAAEERAVVATLSRLTTSDRDDNLEAISSAQKSADRQAEVIAITRKLRSGLAAIAGPAVESVLAGETATDNSKAKLLGIVQQPSGDLKSRTKAATDDALTAARQFADAAKQIRQTIVTTAQELAGRTATTAGQLSEFGRRWKRRSMNCRPTKRERGLMLRK